MFFFDHFRVDPEIESTSLAVGSLARVGKGRPRKTCGRRSTVASLATSEPSSAKFRLYSEVS